MSEDKYTLEITRYTDDYKRRYSDDIDTEIYNFEDYHNACNFLAEKQVEVLEDYYLHASDEKDIDKKILDEFYIYESTDKYQKYKAYKPKSCPDEVDEDIFSGEFVERIFEWDLKIISPDSYDDHLAQKIRKPKDVKKWVNYSEKKKKNKS